MFFNVVFFSPFLTWPLNKERAYYSYNTTTPNWCHFLKLIPILFCGLKKKYNLYVTSFFFLKSMTECKILQMHFPTPFFAHNLPIFSRKKILQNNVVALILHINFNLKFSLVWSAFPCPDVNVWFVFAHTEYKIAQDVTF